MEKSLQRVARRWRESAGDIYKRINLAYSLTVYAIPLPLHCNIGIKAPTADIEIISRTDSGITVRKVIIIRRSAKISYAIMICTSVCIRKSAMFLSETLIHCSPSTDIAVMLL